MRCQIHLLAAISFALGSINACTSPQHSLLSKQTAATALPQATDFNAIPLNHALFSNDTSYSPPSIDDIFQLTEWQQQEFLQFYFDKSRAQLAPDRRVSDFIERRYADFHYYGATQKASDSLQGQSGNCMSLAILTSAYARLVDIEVSYQMVYSTPIYELIEDTLYVSSHVRTRVSSPPTRNQETGVIQFSNSYIDYFPSAQRSRGNFIAEPLFISMFYQNLAAEYLKQNNEQKAILYTKEALRIAPDNAAALNILAVLHRRQQDDVTAEKLYRFILEHHPVNLNAMINYRVMLQMQGRVADAEALTEVLAQLDDPNPYEWIFLADEAIQQNRLTRAERYLERAQHYAPYLDEIYFRLARIDYQRGRFSSAQRHLLTAHHFARTSDRRSLYKAKLSNLHAAE